MAPDKKSRQTPSRSSQPKASQKRKSSRKMTNSIAGPTQTLSGSAISVPPSCQQALLNIFRTAFSNMLSPTNLTDTLQPLLQEVKKHLFNRDFDKAFERADYLEAYAVRWTPSRALGYTQILQDISQHLGFSANAAHKQNGGSCDSDVLTTQITEERKNLPWRSIVCLGGGAGAEICSLAGLHSLISNDDISLSVTAFDIADWSSVISSLSQTLTSAPPLSAYASAAAKAANVPLVPTARFRASFERMDLLNLEGDEANQLGAALAASDLVTIMFTLNELYSTSMSNTQKLLLDLTTSLSRGSFLLVVDSPGSYSTIVVNQSEKTYPMKWLLDHTLLTLASGVVHSSDVNSPGSAMAAHEAPDDAVELYQRQEERTREKLHPHGASPLWEKVISEDSCWFRLPDGLTYPIELENMRYQLHLYRRC